MRRYAYKPKPPTVAYMCKTDYDHHFGAGNDPQGSTVFNSLKELRKYRECVNGKDGCGIVEVVVSFKRLIKKGRY